MDIKTADVFPALFSCFVDVCLLLVCFEIFFSCEKNKRKNRWQMQQ